MKAVRFSSWIPAGDAEEDVEVVAHCYPATPDVFYLKNGDPGYPGDPAECEIVAVKSTDPFRVYFAPNVSRDINPDDLDEETIERLQGEAWEEFAASTEGCEL